MIAKYCMFRCCRNTRMAQIFMADPDDIGAVEGEEGSGVIIPPVGGSS